MSNNVKLTFDKHSHVMTCCELSPFIYTAVLT